MSDVENKNGGEEQTPIQSPAVDPLAALTVELESTRRTLAAIRRERDVHKGLFEAGSHDLDIGAAMIEREALAMPEKPLVELIADLKKRKPGLFARTPATTPAPRPGGSAMSARPAGDDSHRAAAQRAASSGDRTSLLAYLRLRRQPA